MTDDGLIVCETGGRDDGPALVLMHGVGCNRGAWDGVLAMLTEEWPGRWLNVDFRGHGQSFHRAPYGVGVHAADVAQLLDPDEPVTLLGHSMGGAVAIALATGMFGVRVRHAVVFAIKTSWSEEEVAAGQAVAARPRRVFEDETAARERALLVSGLKGLTGTDSRTAALGVEATGGGWRLSTDPRVNATGRAEIAKIVPGARAPIHLYTGEHDAIGPADGMARLGGEVTLFPGLGHSPHVEAPEAFWATVRADVLAL